MNYLSKRICRRGVYLTGAVHGAVGALIHGRLLLARRKLCMSKAGGEERAAGSEQIPQ